MPEIHQVGDYRHEHFSLLVADLFLDLLHSYFGMVSLAFQGEPGLGRVDPALGASERAVRHLESLAWWQA